MIKLVTKSIIRINHILSIIVLTFGAYILLIPVIPEIDYAISYAKSVNETPDVPAIERFRNIDIQNESTGGVASTRELEEVSADNQLIIPQIFVDGEIFEGDKSVLQKGMWRRPNTSTPDQGGNTVIVAHRFLFTSGPNTFYHLDKLEVGDKFSIIWEGKVYNYEVFETTVVEPTAIEIEDNTDNPIVTLYTCTPLYTADKRLVVKANLVE